MLRLADSQDWLFRLEDLGTAFRQLPRARLRHDGAGGARFLRDDVGARNCAGAYRGARGRACARRTRRLDHLRAAARQFMYFVATEVDSKRRCDKEASMVKWFASEMAERVTSDALQIHGGYGYTKDLPLERYWRDARLTKIFEGTSQIQLRIISDRLMGASE